MAEETRRCIDCNKEFISSRKNQVRCPECQKAHLKVTQQNWKRKIGASISLLQILMSVKGKDLVYMQAR